MINDEFIARSIDVLAPRILHILKLFNRALERYSSTSVITYDMYKKKIKKRKKLMKRRKK